MILRILPAFLVAAALSGCVPAGDAGVAAPAASQPRNAPKTGLAALEQEFAALAPEDQRLTMQMPVLSLQSSEWRFLKAGNYGSPVGRRAEFMLQIDLSQDAPIYRVILSDADFAPDAPPPSAPDFKVVASLGGGQMAYFVVPDFAQTWKGDGLYGSDWLTCDHCIPPRWKNTDEKSYRQAQARTLDRLRESVVQGERPKLPTILFEKSDDILVSSIVAGRGQAVAAAGETSSKLAESRAARAEGLKHEPEYFAFRKEIDALTLEGHVRKLGCLTGYQSTTQGGTREWRQLLDHNERFIDCRIRALETYDHEGFAARFPEIAARENALAAKAYGVQRPPLYTPEGQVKELIKLIEQVEAVNEHADYAIAYNREQRAKRERARQRRQAVFLSFQRSISAAQAQVRDMAPVVRSDGALSSVGAERRRAEAAATAAARSASSARAERTAAAGRSAGGSSGASSGGSRSGAPAKRAASAASGGEYSLYLATGKGKVDARCNPLNVMTGDRLARCRLLWEVESYRVQLAQCRTLSDGTTTPAEVIRDTTHLILSVDGLTAEEHSRLQQAADRGGRPFAASPSAEAVRSAVEADNARFGTVAEGVRTFYKSEWQMKKDLRAKGCASYEMDGKIYRTH